MSVYLSGFIETEEMIANHIQRISAIIQKNNKTKYVKISILNQSRDKKNRTNKLNMTEYKNF